MRDWLTVIIVLLIIVILIDGVRRMRLARRDKIRMSRNIYKSKGPREETSAATDTYPSELPNGGARVVAHRDSVPTSAPSRRSKKESRRPQQTSLNLNESVPMLMEVNDDVLMKKSAEKPQVGRAQAMASGALSKLRETASRAFDQQDTSNSRGTRGDVVSDAERIEPTLSASEAAAQKFTAEDGDQRGEAAYDEYQTPARTQSTLADGEGEYGDAQHEAGRVERAQVESDRDDQSRYEADAYEEDYDSEDLEEDEDVYQEELVNDEEEYLEDDEDYSEDDYPEEADAEDDRAQDVYASERSADSKNDRALVDPEEVLIINIMAPAGQQFAGDALLDSLLKCGMRFGDMDIFHRYSDSKGEGALLFSLANMVKPGTFDLDMMEQFETPGVSLFMTLPIKADSMQSFELMVDTARSIAEALDGELKDEQRSVMTRQTIEHCRERIRDFERRRLFSRQR